MNTRKLTRDDVDISVFALSEDSDPAGHFATGDAAEDARIVAKIREDMQWNEWAWCCVKVVVTYRGLEASDYLGGVNEVCEQSFRDSEYFTSMVDTCLDDLNSQVAHVVSGVIP